MITTATRRIDASTSSGGVLRLRLNTGVTIEYVERGRPDGVPVVFLHGLTDSWRSFEPVLPHLPTSIRAIALTQRGHGDAERPATGYHAHDFANDVDALLDALGIASAVVVGHSMGATNAARFALDYPARVRGLVLIGAFAAYGESPAVVCLGDSVAATLNDPIDPAFVRAFQESTLAQAVPEDLVETVVAESLKVPARVWRASVDALLDDECAREWAAIVAPTLLLWGARDALSLLEQQYALVESIALAQFVVYERAGHAVHWEEPARVASDIRRFVEELGGAT